MFHPRVLFRPPHSKLWNLREFERSEDAQDYYEHSLEQGGEQVYLSSQAMRAFFQLVPEARALVQTNVLCHRDAILAWSSKMKFLSFFALAAALVIAGSFVQAYFSVREWPYARQTLLYLAIPSVSSILLIAFAGVQLLSIGRLMRSLIDEMERKVPLMQNLHAMDEVRPQEMVPIR